MLQGGGVYTAGSCVVYVGTEWTGGRFSLHRPASVHPLTLTALLLMCTTLD